MDCCWEHALQEVRRWLSRRTLPEGYPADYKEIVATARTEKSLLIYTNMEVVQWEGAVKILKEMVPGIDVRFLELNSGEIVSRYNAETSAGIPSADLMVTTDAASWVSMMEKGQILPYESPEAGIYPKWSKPHPGLYTIAADPMMFMWNKALLPKGLEPSSFADLVEKVKANPSVFKNKLTTYNPQTPYGYNAFYAFTQYHGDKAWDWIKAIGPMTRPDGTGPMIEKVTSGEYVLAYFMGAGAARLALKDPARASIIGLKPIADGNPVVLRGDRHSEECTAFGGGEADGRHPPLETRADQPGASRQDADSPRRHIR